MNRYYLHHVNTDFVLHHLLLEQVNKLGGAFKNVHVRVEHQSYYREGDLSLWIHSHSLLGGAGEVIVEIVGETELLPIITAVRDFIVEPVTVGEILSYEGTAITISRMRSSSTKKKPFAHVTKFVTTIKYSVSCASSSDNVQVPAIHQQSLLRFVLDFRRTLYARCNDEALLFVGRGGYAAHPSKLFLSDWIDLSAPGILFTGLIILYRTGDKAEERAAADILESIEDKVDSITANNPDYRKQITEKLSPSVDTWGVKGISSKGSRFSVYA